MAQSSLRKKIQLSAVALALSSLPLGAHAAGLGDIKVISVLGQPLLAEIDITASRDEIPSLAARLASHEAFQQAGIDYNPVLSQLKVSIETRSNGHHYLRLKTDQALNEPFLDLLLEMSWAAGRLQREYLFLLDPPEALQPLPAEEITVSTPVVAETSQTPPSAPSATLAEETTATMTTPPAGTETPATKPADSTPQAAAPAAPATVATAAATSQATATTAPPRTVEVKPGDTLSKIASEALQTVPPGINLDQMLIALLRNNREAFIDGNINRLRAGKILSLPDQASLADVDAAEARTQVVAQAADFDAYRKKLASATAATPAAPEAAPQQLATGKIEARVEAAEAPPQASKDKLEISKSAALEDTSDSTGEATEEASPSARAAAIEEDFIAREKTLQEANSRIAELDKNLADMRRALELKSQTLAEAQQHAEQENAQAKSADAADTAELAGSEDKQAQPPAEKKPAKKKLAPAPQPEPEEPSFIADNPELVFGGGALIALLLGYLGFTQWRRKRADQTGPAAPARDAADADTDAGTDTNASAPADSTAFTSNGGQVVDTESADSSSLDTDFSVVSPSQTDSSESVDPIAEADVYMAYGRTAQAEEILLDALKKEPTRHAVHLKLLGIYAERKSLKQFETLAGELQQQTGGTGEDWAQAARLGLSIDPDNPLYQQGAQAQAASGTTDGVDGADEVYDPTATMVLTPQDFDKLTTELEPEAEQEVAEVVEEVPESLDFELDLGSGDSPMAPAQDTPEAQAVETADAAAPVGDDLHAALDFDLDAPLTASTAAPELNAPATDTDTDTAAPSLASNLATASDATGGQVVDFEEIPALEPTPVEMPTDELSSALPTLSAETEASPAAITDNAADSAEDSTDDGGNSIEFAMDDADEAAAPAPIDLPATSAAASGIDLSSISLELDDVPATPPAAAATAAADFPELDIPPLSAAAADLSAPLTPQPAATNAPADPTPFTTEADSTPDSTPDTPAADDSGAQAAGSAEVDTKLELASAYEEMGDLEGARELLEEVLKEGNAAQQAAARDRLAQLA